MRRPHLPTLRGLRARDERGSMALYLVIAVMGMALSALMIPMIITSSQVTRSDTSRVHALDAAQAGINVMLGQVRAANIDGVGTSTLLPCTGTSGKVNGSGDATYSVKIDYYMNDPVANPTTAKMGCVAGYGTYDPVTDGFTPRFARITATGKDSTSQRGSTRGRTLTATYIFRTTNSNIVGGRIRIYPASSTSAEMCMDAGSANPTAGTVITLQPCSSPPKDQQVFAYRSDLTIQLLSSIGTDQLGLCLDTLPAPTAGRTINLQKCKALGTTPTYTQQWSFNDQGGYTASLSDSAGTGTLSSQCINASNQGAGTQLTLANCSAGNTSSPTQAWIPAPAVGAGAASTPQLVNYYEFGRCLDVTGQNVNADHLIDYPCKQNPKKDSVAWNQEFTLPVIAATATSATGTIYTTPSTNYCLTSPGTEEGLVVVIPCAAGNARQQWTVYGGSPALPYSAKFQIVDSFGRCLGLKSPVGAEVWSSIDTERCTGATEQKWNATPNLGSAILQDFDEIPTP